MKKLIQTVAFGATILFGLLSLLAHTGRWHWAGDAVALFIPYFAGITAVFLFLFISLRYRPGIILAAGALLLNLIPLVPYVPTARLAVAEQPADLRLMMHNIYYQNNELDTIWAEVEAHDPDVIFLMEYSFAIQEQIEAQFADYPYRLIEPSRMTMGLALFSRIPITASEVHRFNATRIPIFEATFDLNGQPVTLVGGHPWPPLGRWGGLHRAQVADIQRVAEQAPGPVIVAGDFNAAPWSYTMRQLGRSVSATDTRRGYGGLATWYGLPFVNLSLDHVLVPSGLRVQDYFYGRSGGSDHLPIIVDFGVES